MEGRVSSSPLIEEGSRATHAKKFSGTTLLATPVRVGEAKRAVAVWASLPLSGTWGRELALRAMQRCPSQTEVTSFLKEPGVRQHGYLEAVMPVKVWPRASQGLETGSWPGLQVCGNAPCTGGGREPRSCCT